jgi:hypothetical protein
MAEKDPLNLYMRSPLNMTFIIAIFTAIVIGAVLNPQSLVFIIPGSIFVYLISTFIILRSKIGAGQVISEQDQDRTSSLDQKLKEAADYRDKISFIRLGQGPVNNSRQLFLVTAGAYLELCRDKKIWSPEAHDAIESALELIQVYLESKDQNSISEHYSPNSNQNLDDPETAVSQALDARTGIIKSCMLRDLGELPPGDKLDILEEDSKN